MKTITTALQAHLAQAVTSLAMCWMVIRRDGLSFAFTSLDEDIVFDGVTYSSVVGFSRSAISSGSTAQVDNLETVGFFSATGITEDDVKKGLFNYAMVQLFMVNWMDLTQGMMKVRQGWLGEVNFSTAADGAFMTELRGLTQALTQESGNFFTPICRADLGDQDCTVPVKPGGWVGNYAMPQNIYVCAVTQSTDALLTAIFQAQNSGTSGATEPVWNSTVGGMTVDGEVTWKCMPSFRGLGTVTSVASQRSFTCNPLAIPGAAQGVTNVATVSFGNNISAFTAITVSDGVVTAGWETPYDIRGSGDHNQLDAVDQLQKAIQATTLNVTTSISGTVLTIVNHSGLQGSITKTGDYLGGAIIVPFGEVVLDGGAITWISGLNTGITMELKTYDNVANVVNLWLAMPYAIAAGDRFLYYPGCDKTRNTCYRVFSNVLNFRGEPDMRGMDIALSYPDV